MKITKQQLTKIIKEELEAVMNEEEKLINRGNFKGFDKKTAGKLELLFKLSEVLQKAAKTSRVALPTKPNQYQEKSEEDFAAYKAMIDIFDKESLENTIEQLTNFQPRPAFPAGLFICFLLFIKEIILSKGVL